MLSETIIYFFQVGALGISTAIFGIAWCTALNPKG